MEQLKLALSMRPQAGPNEPRGTVARPKDAVPISTSNLPQLDWSFVITPKGRASNFQLPPASALVAPSQEALQLDGPDAAAATFDTFDTDQLAAEARPPPPQSPADPFSASPALGGSGGTSRTASVSSTSVSYSPAEYPTASRAALDRHALFFAPDGGAARPLTAAAASAAQQQVR